MNNKLQNIMDKMTVYANKSTITHQHAAVLLKNGKPIMWGYNKLAIHAECDVIKQYLKCLL